MARFDGGLEIAALRTNSRNEQWHLAHDGSHLSDFIREGGAHNQTNLTAAIPHFRCHGSDVQIQWPTIACNI
jgi:hypothetical protein